MGSELQKIPLYPLHLELGARMVPFAGYQMPLQYQPSLIQEHLHVRKAAGLFDVSHMGQISLRPRSGDIADATRALERLVPSDILSLNPGRLRYAFFTNAEGGILDDLVVANLGAYLLLVVNAARKADDEAHVRAALADVCDVVPLEDRVLLALQGPQAEAVLARLNADCAGMRFLDARTLELAGTECLVMRSGYTGEDGFEISLPAGSATALAKSLLAEPEVLPVGLGARDSLRLEAGLCLYGADLDEVTTPVEAGLAWAIFKVRHRGGAREGGFPGSQTILDQLEHGTARARVGLSPEGRMPVRGGAPLFAAAEGGVAIGKATSGGFGPSLDAPVAMGYVETAYAAPRTTVFAEIRGKRVPANVVPLPFITTNYRRGAADRRRRSCAEIYGRS
jgi:aminomethyltransferase